MRYSPKLLVALVLGFTLIYGTTVAYLIYENNRIKKEAADRAQADQQKLEAEQAKLKEEQTKRARAEEKIRDQADARQRDEAANYYASQAGRQLDKVAGVLLTDGFKSAGDYQFGSLAEGTSKSFAVKLDKGILYKIISTCDEHCNDMDLAVYDDRNVKVAADVERDDLPEVTVMSPGTGTFRVEVTMYGCRQAPCFYGIGLFGKE